MGLCLDVAGGQLSVCTTTHSYIPRVHVVFDVLYCTRPPVLAEAYAAHADTILFNDGFPLEVQPDRVLHKLTISRIPSIDSHATHVVARNLDSIFLVTLFCVVIRVFDVVCQSSKDSLGYAVEISHEYRCDFLCFSRATLVTVVVVVAGNLTWAHNIVKIGQVVEQGLVG